MLLLDPTCGSAGMLISAVAHLKAKKKEWRNVSLYGQEFNALTCAIGRMNLFLHGIEDFHIAGGDTLEHPAFTENDKLRQFDMIVANPPYSINQWNRNAFERDKYGRNILGVPPQSRADYAFLQHILASLKPETGRCAILFPHGVLFRGEEKEMREKLVRADWVDAVIGLGPNLFYNSPMEACIVICRTKKPDAHRGHVLFINAVHEVARKNAQSNLEPQHIARIAKAYAKYKSEEGFAKKVSLRDIETNDFSLNISLYVQTTAEESNREMRTVAACYAEWKKSSREMRKCYEQLNALLTTQKE